MDIRDFKTQVLPVSQKLLRFACCFLKNEELARDVVQDVFLKLWQKRDTLHEVENIEAFSMRMTRNRCLDIIRTNKLVEITPETELQIEAGEGDVYSKIELSESAMQIRSLVKKLPNLQQTVMHLRDIEQFSYDAIAEVTGLKPNAIRVNLSRARKKVRDEFLKMNEMNLKLLVDGKVNCSKKL